MSDAARAHVVVRGRVQGVFFRAETGARARSLGISGWIHNNADGSVEAVFEGAPERVRLLVDWCGRGPRGAEVEAIELDWATPLGEDGFIVA